MARKKKVSLQQVREGDIVVLYSEKGCEGNVIGSGVVERLKPIHGFPEKDMVWVPGFTPHDPEAVERIGAPFELIGKLKVTETELEDAQEKTAELQKDLQTVKEKLDSAVKAMDKTTSYLAIVDGNDHLDARSVVKWIKDVKAKFSLSAIREVGQRPTKKESDKKDDE